jgi:hypothetical protein
LPNEFQVAPLAPSSAGGKSLASPVPQGDAPGFDSTTTEPLRPLNLLFGAVFVIGLGVLVASVLRGRRTV